MGVRKTDIERWRSKWSSDFLAQNPSLEGSKGTPSAKPCDFPAKSDPIQPKSPLAMIFEKMWSEIHGATLVPEHRFCETRKWRFDYAIPEHKLAIELEGGIHQRKGHASPEGYKKDCRKYNAAAADGWLVFRLASGMMTLDDVGFVARAIQLVILDRQADSF